MSFFTLSDVGKVRTNNEDFAESFEFGLCKADGSNDKIVSMVLADGMGGGPAGERASSLAVQTIKMGLICDYLSGNNEISSEEYLDIIEKHVQKAQLNIYKDSIENPDINGMGTTVVVGVISNGKLSLAHVGDSRAYIFNENGLAQQTRDHSLVQEYVDAGAITEEEAFSHPQKNIITRVLGAGSGAPVKIDKRIVNLKNSDIVMFCTDGLCGVLKPNEIIDIFQKFYLKDGTDLKYLANALIQSACLKGGPDNVTVTLYQHFDK